MEEIQEFRLPGSVDVKEIFCSHVEGQSRIYLEDTEQVFEEEIKHVKNGNVFMPWLRDSNGMRYFKECESECLRPRSNLAESTLLYFRITPHCIKHYPGVVLEIVLSSAGNPADVGSPMTAPSLTTIGTPTVILTDAPGTSFPSSLPAAVPADAPISVPAAIFLADSPAESPAGTPVDIATDTLADTLTTTLAADTPTDPPTDLHANLPVDSSTDSLILATTEDKYVLSQQVCPAPAELPAGDIDGNSDTVSPTPLHSQLSQLSVPTVAPGSLVSLDTSVTHLSIKSELSTDMDPSECLVNTATASPGFESTVIHKLAGFYSWPRSYNTTDREAGVERDTRDQGPTGSYSEQDRGYLEPATGAC